MLRTVNQPDKWVKKEGAFEAIVPPEVFYMAQGIIRGRTHRYSSEELIEKLRNLFEHRGCLSGLVIDETEGMLASPPQITVQPEPRIQGTRGRQTNIYALSVGRSVSAIEK